MKHPLLLITAIAAAVSCISGCASKRIEVKEGEWKRLYTPAEVYTEVFVDTPESSMVTTSSHGSEHPHIRTYYDGVILEKIMMLKESEGMMIILDGEFHEADSYTFKSISEKEGKREIKEYKLELIETTETKQDEPVASGQRR
jgi:hypothetical protein